MKPCTLLLYPLVLFGSALAFVPSYSNYNYRYHYTTTTTTRSTRSPFFRPTSLFGTPIDNAKSEAKDRMAKSIESVLENLGTVRAGRASPQILDRIKCDYYGTATPIHQMATILAPAADKITVEPYDKNALKIIERAILEADIGLTPRVDGNMVHIPIPPISEDRRKDLLKSCKTIVEEGRVAVRNIRRKCVDQIKKLEKGGDISKDMSKDAQDEIQTLTNKKIKEIDQIYAKKEKEITTI